MFKKRSKTFYQYLFSYVTIMLWSMSIIAFFVIFYLFPLIKSDMRSSHYSVLEQTAAAIDADIQIISRASYQLSYSSENLQSYLLLDDTPNRDMKIINELESHASISSIINEIGLLSPDYDFVYTSSGIYPKEIFFNNIYTYPLYKDAAAKFCSFKANTVLPSSFLEISNIDATSYKARYLTFINPPYALSSLPNTTLLFWVDENQINETLKKVTNDSSYIIVFDTAGNVLASAGSIPDDINLLRLHSEAVDHPNTAFDSSDNNYHLFTYHSNDTDWIYVYAIDNIAAFEGMNTIFMVFSAIIIIALIIGILIIWRYMVINYVPIKLLKNITDKLTDEDYISENAAHGKNEAVDEISSLSSALTYLSNQKANELDMIKDSDLIQSLKATLLFSVLKGHVSSVAEFNQNGEALNMQLNKPNFQIILVQFSGTKGSDNTYQILDILLQEALDEHYQYYFREFFDENQFAVLIAFDDRERNLVFSRYTDLKNAAIEKDMVITIGVGKVYRNISSMASSSLEASRALHNSFVLGHNSVIIYDDQKFSLLNHEQFHSFDVLGLMQTALQKNDYALFSKHAEQIFQKIFEQQALSDYAKNLCYSITSLLITELSRESLKQHTNTLLLMYQADTLTSYKHYLNEIIKALTADLAEPQAVEQKDLITQIKQYIHQNYDDCNFSVQKVADAFELNNSYLSLYFKSQTSININNYISALRVQKAKHLLTSTNLTLSMISEEVGYYNQNSFIRRFKQITGMTPGDYRKNHSESKE